MTYEEFKQITKADETNPQPSYFTILTAEVRYSEEISDFEKILFSEIVTLTKADGFCYALNDYFAKCFKKTKEHISRSINNLKKAGFIDTELIYNNKEVVARIIYIKLSIGVNKNVETPLCKNVKTPPCKNVKDNNININNTRDNSSATHPHKNLEQVSEREYNEFEKAIIVNYHKLKGQAISDIRQIKDFKTLEQRLLLQTSFESRQNSNWQQAIDKAIQKAYDEPAEFRWYSFINHVYLNLADVDKKQKPKKSFKEMSETQRHNFLVSILENELTEPRLDWISYTEKTLMYQMNEDHQPVGKNHFEDDEFAWKVFNRYNELYKQYENA